MDPRHQNRLVLTLVQAVRTFSEKRIVVWWCAVTGPRSKKMPSHPLWPFPLDVQAWRNFLHQAYTRHRHKLEILRIDLSPPAPSRRAIIACVVVGELRSHLLRFCSLPALMCQTTTTIPALQNPRGTAYPGTFVSALACWQACNNDITLDWQTYSPTWLSTRRELPSWGGA